MVLIAVRGIMASRVAGVAFVVRRQSAVRGQPAQCLAPSRVLHAANSTVTTTSRPSVSPTMNRLRPLISVWTVSAPFTPWRPDWPGGEFGVAAGRARRYWRSGPGRVRDRRDGCRSTRPARGRCAWPDAAAQPSSSTTRAAPARTHSGTGPLARAVTFAGLRQLKPWQDRPSVISGDPAAPGATPNTVGSGAYRPSPAGEAGLASGCRVPPEGRALGGRSPLWPWTALGDCNAPVSQ